MAAKSYTETDRQVRDLIQEVKSGVFKPVYLLMGEEPYYPDLLCQAIIDNCLQDWEKDFNELICYGADADADAVITAARRFPMMAERQLVVVKEAQAMKTLEDLALYCQKPLDSTVLVILMHGASADKRKSLYKTVLKQGVIVESLPLRDYETEKWVMTYYSERGLQIDPEGARLLVESTGTDLGRIAVETEKLLKNLPEGVKNITPEDIEKNVGISRQYSIFELTKALSFRDAPRAVKVARNVGETPKFAMPMAVSMLYTHFNRILRYHALIQAGQGGDSAAKAKVLGVNPYFFKEYDAAVKKYSLKQAMRVISLLNDYDFKGKGGEVGEATPADLLVELTTKILNI
ncbi:MAG: DNA polymerase III subunit delta [Bacteroidales bacterium]|nr:DNA polymerase III subunit delta [Bacteroidales bacterium]